MVKRSTKLLFLLALLALGLLLATGCQTETAVVAAEKGEPEATATQQPTETAVSPTQTSLPPTQTPLPPTVTPLPPTATPEPTFTPTPGPKAVTIEGYGRIQLAGTFFPGPGEGPWPGVILVHVSGDDRHVWEENGFAELLVANGYGVLTVDIRSHGDSGGDSSWSGAEIDMRRWWNYFSGREDIDAARTAMVGGSIGANLSLFTAMQKPDIVTVVLLSPGLKYNSADIAQATIDYGERPIFLIGSEDDLFPAAEDSRIMADLAQGEAEVLVYEDAGHGTNMLDAKPELAGLIVEWLDRYLK